MSSQQILQKAISRAIDGGWINPSSSRQYWSPSELAKWLIEIEEVPCLIFNHEFAKSIWGEEPVRNWTLKSNGELDKPAAFTVPVWKIRLQEMVIAEDPVRYLGDNLDG